MAVEGQVGIREVVHDEHLSLAGEADDVLHEVELDGGSRRVVREGQKQHARARGGPCVGVREVRNEVFARRHRDLEDARPREDRRMDVDRVARRGHERCVAGLDQRPHEVDEALLRAHRRDDLRLGVELHAEPALVEVGAGGAQLGDAP